MNRLNIFLSISALSLASSVSAANTENEGFKNTKENNQTTTIVEKQSKKLNQSDVNNKDTSLK